MYSDSVIQWFMVADMLRAAGHYHVQFEIRFWVIGPMLDELVY